MTFEMPTHCMVCGGRLTPFDMRHWHCCDECMAAGREFARDLPPEHEHESPETVDA